MNFFKILQALIGRSPFPGKHCCNICGHHLSRFIPYDDVRAIKTTLPKALDVIGSDTINFQCPWCGAHDRERHILMYMEKSGLLDDLRNYEILHFAPEKRLPRLITSQNPRLYIKCDLFPKTADIKCVDILDIPYNDRSFDLVIANHILEHVTNDILALTEIHRILKPSGYAILQTPFSPRLHTTWSDDGINSEYVHLIAYGQKDHVRLYGRDIFERFAKSGLKPQIQQHETTLPQFDPYKYGVNVYEPFFLFKRAH